MHRTFAAHHLSLLFAPPGGHRRTLPLGLLILLVLLAPRLVQAHGGEHVLQLDRAVVGDYRLSVWTGPSVLRPGQILLEALITDPTDDVAVKDATVRFQVQYDGVHHSDPPLDLPAAPVESLSERNRREALHLAVADLREVGPYQVRVFVTDPQGAVHQAELAIQVVPDNPWLVRILIALTGITGLITAAFIWHSLRRMRFWWRERLVPSRA